MENISDNITYIESTFSQEAKRFEISNEPTQSQLENMKDLAQNIFEPLRKGLGGFPIHINSFFRSEALNEKVGGAANSQHLANRGAAMDINNAEPNNQEIFDYIKNSLDFDQLISEFPDVTGYPSWVHVSFDKGANRGNVMESYKNGEGETKYKNI